MSILSVKKITVDYGGHKGVFDLSFDVAKGEVVGFLGPNGAGKTTTIRQLMGFAHPDQGQCTVFGKNCRNSADLQQRIGYLPGEITFIEDMNGMQFIRFIAKMKNLTDLSRAQELIQYFELNPSGKIKKMSKGMKQKIGIVCAFMHNPELLILDEPTSGLDPLMQNKFVELIQAERKKGTTVLMSSHMFEEVERTCDRAVIIKEGRLLADELITDLKHKQRKQYKICFETVAMAQAFTQDFSDTERVSQEQVVVGITGEIMPLLQCLTQYHVTSLDTIEPTLEELFMGYYGGKEV